MAGGSLPNRIGGFGGGMSDRSAAQAGFIGEDPTFETHQDHLAEGSTGGRLSGECISNDADEGFRKWLLHSAAAPPDRLRRRETDISGTMDEAAWAMRWIPPITTANTKSSEGDAG
jgi:hypothetical protein